jgi:cytochrome P450
LLDRRSGEGGTAISLRPDPLMPDPPRDAAFEPALDAWVLSRYADVSAAFREPALWPVASRRQKDRSIPNAEAQQLLREQVLDAFSSAALKEWQVRLERAADEMVFDGRADLVAEFVEPWCLAAAETVTGSAAADRHQLLAEARIVSAAAAEPLDERLRSQASAANAELGRYFKGAAIPMAGPVFVALSRTVACLLANGWLALLRHPAQLTQLHARPEQIPRAIEEMLRYAGVPQSVFRTALKPVTLCGLQIAEGDRVILRLASANRDPLQFSNPDRIDFARREPAQLSLGFGPHSCVGAALIRMTVSVATRAFVEKFGDAEICEPIEWQGGEGFRSPATLRVH